MPMDVKENLKKLEISTFISSRNDKQSCKIFFKNDQPILSLYHMWLELNRYLYEGEQTWKWTFLNV